MYIIALKLFTQLPIKRRQINNNKHIYTVQTKRNVALVSECDVVFGLYRTSSPYIHLCLVNHFKGIGNGPKLSTNFQL